MRTVQFTEVDHRNRMHGQPPRFLDAGSATLHDDGTLEYSDDLVRDTMAARVARDGAEAAFDFYAAGWTNGYACSHDAEHAPASY